MRKLWILIVIFLVFGAIATYQILQNQGKENSSFSENEEANFPVQDISQVGKIFIADRKGNQALLKLTDEGWMYTNPSTQKSYRARPDAMRNLLETIESIRARNPVAKPAIDNVVRSLAGESTKVEIYTLAGKKIRTYYVGRGADEVKATHMMMEGAERPYVVDIPNFVGSVHTRYLIDEQEWRDKAIFRIKPSQLEYVQLEYQDPEQEQHSFKLIQNGLNDYTVKAISPKTKVGEPTLFNVDNAATYIEDFDRLFAERVLYNKALRDSIITTRPFLILSYKLKSETEPTLLRVYSLFNPSADRGDGRPGHRQKLQRYYIDKDEEHFFLVQHLVFRNMLWGYDFFFRNAPVVLQEDEASTKGSFPENKEDEYNN